jgi:hypothetical protein
LLGDWVDYLEFGLRKLDAPSQRRIMRRYGVRFYIRPVVGSVGKKLVWERRLKPANRGKVCHIKKGEQK